MISNVLIIDGESYFASVGDRVFDHFVFLRDLERKILTNNSFTSKTIICEQSNSDIFSSQLNKLSENLTGGPEYSVKLTGNVGIEAEIMGWAGGFAGHAEIIVLVTKNSRLLNIVQKVADKKKGLVTIVTPTDCFGVTSPMGYNILPILDSLILSNAHHDTSSQKRKFESNSTSGSKSSRHEESLVDWRNMSLNVSNANKVVNGTYTFSSFINNVGSYDLHTNGRAWFSIFKQTSHNSRPLWVLTDKRQGAILYQTEGDGELWKNRPWRCLNNFADNNMIVTISTIIQPSASTFSGAQSALQLLNSRHDRSALGNTSVLSSSAMESRRKTIDFLKRERNTQIPNNIFNKEARGHPKSLRGTVVYVRGARCAGASGMYEYKGLMNHAGVYWTRKSTVFCKRTGHFMIYCCRINKGDCRFWFLSFVTDPNNFGGSDDQNLYCAPCPLNGRDADPCNAKWFCMTNSWASDLNMRVSHSSEDADEDEGEEEMAEEEECDELEAPKIRYSDDDPIVVPARSSFTPRHTATDDFVSAQTLTVQVTFDDNYDKDTQSLVSEPFAFVAPPQRSADPAFTTTTSSTLPPLQASRDPRKQSRTILDEAQLSINTNTNANANTSSAKQSAVNSKLSVDPFLPVPMSAEVAQRRLERFKTTPAKSEPPKKLETSRPIHVQQEQVIESSQLEQSHEKIKVKSRFSEIVQQMDATKYSAHSDFGQEMTTSTTSNSHTNNSDDSGTSKLTSLQQDNLTVDDAIQHNLALLSSSSAHQTVSQSANSDSGGDALFKELKDITSLREQTANVTAPQLTQSVLSERQMLVKRIAEQRLSSDDVINSFDQGIRMDTHLRKVVDSTLTVSGAGIAEANGVYKYLGLMNRAGHFEHCSSRTRCAIYKCNLEDRSSQWFLSVLPDEVRHPGSARDLNLYCSPASKQPYPDGEWLCMANEADAGIKMYWTMAPLLVSTSSTSISNTRSSGSNGGNNSSNDSPTKTKTSPPAPVNRPPPVMVSPTATSSHHSAVEMQVDLKGPIFANNVRFADVSSAPEMRPTPRHNPADSTPRWEPSTPAPHRQHQQGWEEVNNGQLTSPSNTSINSNGWREMQSSSMSNIHSADGRLKAVERLKSKRREGRHADNVFNKFNWTHLDHLKGSVLRVSNANSRTLEGDYHFAGLMNNAGFFELRSPARATSRHRFVIYVCCVGTRSYSWFLSSVSSSSRDPGGRDDINLYYSLTDSSSGDMKHSAVPLGSWLSLGDDYFEDPRLSVKYIPAELPPPAAPLAAKVHMPTASIAPVLPPPAPAPAPVSVAPVTVAPSSTMSVISDSASECEVEVPPAATASKEPEPAVTVDIAALVAGVTSGAAVDSEVLSIAGPSLLLTREFADLAGDVLGFSVMASAFDHLFKSAVDDLQLDLSTTLPVFQRVFECLRYLQLLDHQAKVRTGIEIEPHLPEDMSSNKPYDEICQDFLSGVFPHVSVAVMNPVLNEAYVDIQKLDTRLTQGFSCLPFYFFCEILYDLNK